MKKSFKTHIVYCFVCIATITALSSCVKSRSGETDFSNLKPIVTIVEGGLATFSKQALTFPGTDSVDTVYFRLNYAAKTVAPADIVVTLGYDDAALATYNTTASNPYVKFPDSIYTFTTTTVTIKAGQSYSDLIPMVVYPSKVDPTKNYMFPISITDASGNTISGNFGTIYYHFIGNPIAGAYNWDYKRWSAADTTGPITTEADYSPAIFAPDDPTTVEVTSGYYSQPRYIITFTNTGGVLSNFQVSLNQEDITSGFTPNNISVTNGPTFLEADPVKGVFRITYSVSSGGAPRVFIDSYYK